MVTDTHPHAVHVREWGPPASSDVVFFWHGAEYHSGASIAEVARHLAAEGVRTIAIDAPGFGRSPAGEALDPAAMARLAAETVARHSRVPAVFAGHSWGAHVACWAGAISASSWRGLFLLDGGFFDFAELFAARGVEIAGALQTLHDLFEQAGFADWPSYFAQLSGGRGSWTPAQEARYRAAAYEAPDGRIRPIVSGATSAAIAAGVVRMRTSTTWPTIAAAGLPVHLLLSTEPAEAAARRLSLVSDFRAALPAAGIESVPDSTHEIVDDAPGVVAARLRAFLDSTSGRRPAADA